MAADSSTPFLNKHEKEGIIRFNALALFPNAGY
jgi:hypothetical protein